ncbi:MAG: thiamine phosphate synthase [Planctomycetia bacterium]
MDGSLENLAETGGNEPGGAAGAWRLLDAAANRAGEALRVLEDVARFVLDDAHLTGHAKAIRHDLAAVLAGPDFALRSACRDTPGDVGTEVVAEAALPRRNAADLVSANAARAAQALRSLQEVALVVAPAAAARFERLRYRLYTLESGLAGTARAVERLAGVSLCVLVDGRADAAAFERLVAGLLEAGVRMIQLRDKRLSVPELLDRGRRAVALAHRRAATETLVVVNDRADVSAAVNAAGVHVGADDLPVGSARRVLGPGALVGRTAHSLAEARAAVVDGADYLGVGPCFPSPTKSFASFAPAEFLSGVVREIALPAFAIGGITLERLDELVALGIRRVAVASAVTEAADPAAAAAAFSDRLARALQAIP